LSGAHESPELAALSEVPIAGDAEHSVDLQCMPAVKAPESKCQGRQAYFWPRLHTRPAGLLCARRTRAKHLELLAKWTKRSRAKKSFWNFAEMRARPAARSTLEVRRVLIPVPLRTRDLIRVVVFLYLISYFCVLRAEDHETRQFIFHIRKANWLRRLAACSQPKLRVERQLNEGLQSCVPLFCELSDRLWWPMRKYFHLDQCIKSHRRLDMTYEKEVNQLDRRISCRSHGV
jgi:hypothetical protein